MATVTGYSKAQTDTLLAGKDAAGAATAAQAAAVQRGNHTGTQTADTITDGTTNKAYTATEKTKLAGIATAATANRTDAATDTLLAAKADLVGGLVPSSQIPAIALTNAVTVASQAAMLALTTTQVQPGDVAVRTDGAGTFILTTTDPTVLGNWVRLNAPTDAVTTVNGQSGTVVLAKTDVGLGNVDNTSDANKPVSTAQAAANGAVARPVPTYAAPRASNFDPRTSMYNGLGKLLNFRAKLGLAATGTGICRIGVVGDSTAIGYQIEPKYSWPNILQQSILPALGFPSAGESAYCQPAGTVADSRMTYTGTGVPTTSGALGRNMTAAGSVQFASTVAGTIAEFQLLGEIGTSTLTIDGATPGSVTIVSGGSGVSYSAGTLTMTTNSYVHVLLQVTGLANTTHTLKVTWASGQVQTERFAVTNTSGVMVDNMGISGSRTVDWIGGPNYRDTFYTPGNFGQSPLFDLLITGLGVNDANGSSGTYTATVIATYKSNLATIATGNSPGYTGPSTADKLLVAAWYNSANPTAATWEPYVTATYDVADSNGIPLIDLSARYTSAPSSAMFVDGVHPNRAGAYRIASDIGRTIAT